VCIVGVQQWWCTFCRRNGASRPRLPINARRSAHPHHRGNGNLRARPSPRSLARHPGADPRAPRRELHGRRAAPLRNPAPCLEWPILNQRPRIRASSPLPQWKVACTAPAATNQRRIPPAATNQRSQIRASPPPRQWKSARSPPSPPRRSSCSPQGASWPLCCPPRATPLHALSGPSSASSSASSPGTTRSSTSGCTYPLPARLGSSPEPTFLRSRGFLSHC
jgi:hypothetical protein